MTSSASDVTLRVRSAWRNTNVPPGAIIWLAVVVLLLIARVTSPNFWESTHLLNVARQASALGILAIGQTFVLISGGLDLSNGAVITLVNVVAATMLRGSDERLAETLVTVTLIGTAVGLANGLIITKLRVPPLVVTLGMYSIVRGTAHVYTDGAPKGDISESLMFVGSGFVGNIPTAIFFWIGFTIVGIVILRRTTYGRQLFAVGGNDKASHLSGVHADRVRVIAYIMSSLTAVVAGLILSGYVGTGSLGIGDGRELDSLAAAVIGGTSLSGGSGTIIGTAGGAFFLALLFSYLRFIGLPYSNQLIVQGAILALAAYAHARAQR
jgi:ribose transport system permease protein